MGNHVEKINPKTIEALRIREQRARFLENLRKSKNGEKLIVISGLDLEGTTNRMVEKIRRRTAIVLNKAGEIVGFARNFDDSGTDNCLPFVPTEYYSPDELLDRLTAGESFTMASKEPIKEGVTRRKRELTFSSLEIPTQHFTSLKDLPSEDDLKDLIKKGNTITVEYEPEKYAEIRPYLEGYDQEILKTVEDKALNRADSWQNLEEGPKAVFQTNGGAGEELKTEKIMIIRSIQRTN